jgi:amino acid adenylation domain-containing protein/non-ribosomal peptide synthase protein (TIGR01720 family)
MTKNNRWPIGNEGHMSLLPIQRISREEALPLSFAQQRLWFLDQLESGSASYNLPAVVSLKGQLNIGALEAAINEIVRRHEILRTTFLTVDGRAAQRIAPVLSLPLTRIKVSNSSEREQAVEVRRLISEESRRPFDLAHGPLIRVSLLQLNEQEHVLLLTMHHIITDGWSMGVLLRELGVLYDAFSNERPSPLPELSIQYTDFAHWQQSWLRGDVLARQLAYWRERLAGAPPTLELPSDKPRPVVQSFRGAAYKFVLPQDLLRQLNELSRREGATLFMTLLATFMTLLYRYTQQEDIVVGTPIANRTSSEMEDLIGFFVNTLLMRAGMSGDKSFHELLSEVRETTLGAYAHQDIPFEKLVEELQPQRDMSRSPLFQVMFVLQNVPMQALELPGLNLKLASTDTGTSKFDLTLYMEETNYSLVGIWEYNTDLFEESTIERMGGHFQGLLRAIVAQPYQALRMLPLLTASEHHQLCDWNQTTAAYPQEVCLHELFEAQVQRTPEHIAVSFQDHKLTYRELNRRANQLAHQLRLLGVGPEVLVGLLMERSVGMMVALLGILKAGGAYLPLDPSYPQERLSFMLADTKAPVLLMQDGRAELLSDYQGMTLSLDERGLLVIARNSTGERSGTECEQTPASGVSAGNLSYVIYTSGSTGRPKGAMNTHGAICNRLLWMQEAYGLGEEDRVLQKTPISFDVSVWELFWPLLTGARLVLAEPGGHRDSEYLWEVIKREQITTLHFVPSMLNVFLEAGVAGKERLASVRRVICSGEALSYETQERFYALGAQAELHNLYGPTEAAVDVTWWACERGSERRVVPIGKPVANTQCYVLDEWGGPVPVGVSGELYLGGVQVGRGYLGRGELTAERFVPDAYGAVSGGRLYRTGDSVRLLEDGNLEYLGRLDHQVKLRGQRIELGEIEAALGVHPAIRNVVVLIREDSPGDRRLVAYIVAEAHERPTVTELRTFLQEQLPDYMIPAVFVTLDELPLTPNGKVDRKALPIPDQSRPDLDQTFIAARTAAEDVLTEIWSQALGVEQIGIHDNFFELGGDSILSIQIINKASQAGLNFTPRQLFQHQSIAALAAVASIDTAIEAEQGIVVGPVPLTPIQQWFFEHSVVDPQHFNQALMLELRQPLEATLLRRALEYLHKHHDALRLRFEQGEAGWQQRTVETANDTGFSVMNISDFAQEEQASAIEEMAATVQGSLNLSDGPLLKVVLFELGAAQAGRLLLVAHHLIIDGLSWRILLEDLQKAYTQVKRGEEIALGLKTSSFQQWGKELEKYARTAELDQTYWMDTRFQNISSLPRDKNGINTAATAQTLTVKLSPEETRALLQKVPAAYHTHINEALLTAVAQAFKQWSGRQFFVDLEGHGREDLMVELNLSRTVGWFTAIYPVLLEVPNGAGPGDALKSIKEQLRSIPRRGISYGLLRYLSAEKAEMRAFPDAEVIFNYLGQLDQALSELPLFTFGKESIGPSQSPRATRRHLIEINGSILERQLQMSWTYSENVHNRSTIERLSGAFIDSLRNLITHCQSEEAGGFTPSDFPLARLDQRKLGKLTALINKKDKLESLRT